MSRKTSTLCIDVPWETTCGEKPNKANRSSLYQNLVSERYTQILSDMYVFGLAYDNYFLGFPGAEFVLDFAGNDLDCFS